MIIDIFQAIPTWQLASLFSAGVITFIIATIAGGGGALLLIPVTSSMLGNAFAAPVINLGIFLSSPWRLYLFWRDVDWSLVKCYVPSAIAGVWLAALSFNTLDLGWIQLLVGLFLVSTIFQYRFGKVAKTFNMPRVGFIPLGLFIGFFSTLVGGLGPVLNPFYMNAGLNKENLIGTKIANAFFVGLIQIASYTYFGILTTQIWLYGLAVGAGAILGTIIGKRFLAGMSIRQFRVMVIILMVFAGSITIIRNIHVLF